jgi:Flp pilus assembly secretin CpaC
MRSIVTVVVLAIASPVLLAGPSAFGAGGKLITPSVSNDQPQEAADSQPAVKELRPSGRPILLQASQGTLLHLPRAAHTVFVADPEVADVQMSQQSDLIYVNGKKGGRTVLYAADEAGHILLNSFIEVTPGPVAIIKRGEMTIGGQPGPTPQSTTVIESTYTQRGGAQQSTSQSTTSARP